MKTDSESIKYRELGKFLSKGIENGLNEVVSEGRKIELNQSVKADAGKPKLSLVPSQIIWDIAEVREYGNKKYPEGGKDNWKQVEMERYVDALYRHFLAFVENPWSKDTESGIFHYKHMACNMAFICSMMEDCKIPESGFVESGNKPLCTSCDIEFCPDKDCYRKHKQEEKND